MAQTQTQNYAPNIQSAEQKFAQAAYFLKMKISKTIAVFKQKVAKLTSGSSSQDRFLRETVGIKDLKDHVIPKYAITAEFQRSLPLM